LIIEEEQRFLFAPVAALQRSQEVGGYMSSVSVLIAKDYEPFRQYVCSTLRKRTDLQIVGEVSDGLEAVQKAEELLPDVIL
jgi:PleD family two-component response regulator